VVAEPDRAKWELAREAGARELVDPGDAGALKALLKASRGGAAAVVDFVGSGASFDFGAGALRKGGKLVCVGLLGGATGIVPAMLALKAISIVGSYVGTLQELRELIALAREGALPPLPVHARPLDEANEALSELRAGQVRGRAVLRPTQPENLPPA
jgi:D-arabinose 1-dehydrogenase-like Zn-dependent alcohol dehydrogenase